MEVKLHRVHKKTYLRLDYQVLFIPMFFSIGKNTGNLLRELDGKCKKFFLLDLYIWRQIGLKKRKDLKKLRR